MGTSSWSAGEASHAFWDHDGTLAVDLSRVACSGCPWTDEELERAERAGGVLYHPEARGALLWTLEHFDHCWWLTGARQVQGEAGGPPTDASIRRLAAGLDLEPELIARIRLAPWRSCKSEALAALLRKEGQSWVLIDDEPTVGLLRWLSAHGWMHHWVRCRADTDSSDLRLLPEICEQRGLVAPARLAVARGRCA